MQTSQLEKGHTRKRCDSQNLRKVYCLTLCGGEASGVTWSPGSCPCRGKGGIYQGFCQYPGEGSWESSRVLQSICRDPLSLETVKVPVAMKPEVQLPPDPARTLVNVKVVTLPNPTSSIPCKRPSSRLLAQ